MFWYKQNKSNVRMAFIYLNFAARMNSKISHIGLGNAAYNTTKTLNALGINAEVWPVKDENYLIELLKQDNNLTHVIISAPWVSTFTLAELSCEYPHIQFIVLSHSNVGFLFADRNGIKKLREELILQKHLHNFYVAGNCKKFCDWAQIAWNEPMLYLPNLYYVNDMKLENKSWDRSSSLKIGMFGATRVLKNCMTAAAAALKISKILDVHTELWFNNGRTEGNFNMGSVEQLVGNIDGFSIHYKPWSHVDEFRKFIGTMNLNLQPSYTESFNQVCADSIYESVPVVVSDAINWAPKKWIGNADDANHLAKIGVRLINTRYAAKDGQVHLRKYVKNGIKEWTNFINETY